MNSRFVMIIRIIFGIILLFLGLNKMFQFMKMPMPEEAMAFFGTLMKAKIPYLISIIEVIAGVLLIVKKAVPLSVIAVFPILISALLFHIFLAPGGIIMTLVALIFEIILIIAYKDKYLPMLE